jgi:hypothetical protein
VKGVVDMFLEELDLDELMYLTGEVAPPTGLVIRSGQELSDINDKVYDLLRLGDSKTPRSDCYFTTSRDACKVIRPLGWTPRSCWECSDEHGLVSWRTTMYNKARQLEVSSGLYCETEEISELACTLMAIYSDLRQVINVKG